MINKIINNKSKLLTENYFELQKHLESIYGNKTTILIEIGSFYEIYEAEIGTAKEIAKILNIAITKKNKSIPETNEKNPLLCGIPSLALDKHLEKLISENEWNIVLIKQKSLGANPERYLEKIISPGTKTEFLNDDYNFIACLYLEKNSDEIYYGGLTLIDVSIGNVLTYESYGTKEDVNYALDNFRSIISKYSVSELIVVSEDAIEFDIKTHFKTYKDVKKELNIAYQNELFKKSFKLESFLSPIEELNLELKPNVANSLSILLTFILEHNYHLAEHLNLPKIIDDKKYLYLGNNALEQLNIINTNVSLEKMINKGISAIGRRFIKEQLLNPLRDINILNDRFNKTIELLHNDVDYKSKLKKIYDIERIGRKIVTDKIIPSEIYNLYKTIKEIEDINKTLPDELKEDFDFSVLKNLEDIFKIEKMQFLTLNNISDSFIKEGVSKDLDKTMEQLNVIRAEFLDIAKKIKDDIESFKDIGYSETEGYYIELTKKRYESLNVTYDKKVLKNSIKIYPFDTDKIVSLEVKMINLTKEIFINEMEKIKDLDISKFSLFIGHLEFYLNNVELIKKYNYKIPELIDKEAFIDFKNIRHPIIERFEHNGVYISNDVCLGKFNPEYNEDIMQGENEVRGLMLYGLNSAGKTSLSKAIGIAIIMAQSGFPVAGDCRFSIFNNLFTRIKGEDDLEKGLSTFAVEMIEVKNILNRADDKTFVLGDEISHGTETTSGLSIVSATVLELIEKKSLFIFSTHLHQLRKIEEFNKESLIKDVHLSVIYNEIEDELIYDRRLKAGSGSSLYGLEFAKYLKLPNSFLKKAYEIRNKLAEDLNESELLVKNKRSKYNVNHIITCCEICKEPAEDVHHILEQQHSVNGFIGEIRKNHKYNLVNLCKKHHKEVHDGSLIIKGYIKTSKGIKLDAEHRKLV